jgi:uncharacterized protein (DUF849 family)
MLAGTSLPWAVAVIGGDVVGCGLAGSRSSARRHVRVGLEDYAGPRTPANDLVAEVVRARTRAPGSIATPAETASPALPAGTMRG